jgi:hypothetical protein
MLRNALMMEAASTSETSMNLYQTTRRNIPEDSHLHIRQKLQPKLDCYFTAYIPYYLLF